MKKEKMYTVYKIYYGDELVYVGRTHQPLQDRIRGHVFRKPHMRVIDINQVTKIEYTTLDSEADMFLVELYLICLYKPRLNKDDKPHDNLSLILPPIPFYPWSTPLWDKWKQEIAEKDAEEKVIKDKKRKMEEKIREKKRNILLKYKKGEITHDEYFDLTRELREEKAKFLYDIGEISFEEYKEEMGFLEIEEE